MRLLAASVLFVFLSSPVYAADATGQIVGTVRDSSGAVVSGAVVTAQNTETGVERQTVTNGTGDYALPHLPSALYAMSFNHDGFRAAFVASVKLDVDQVLRIDMTLLVGAVTQQLTVTAETPLLQRDSSTSGQVVGNTMVASLPLNERNFLTYSLLVPGAAIPTEGSQNSTQGGSVNVNGAREQMNNFLLDGTDNNDQYINRYTVLPSVEAIEEFKVQSSTSTADYGRDAGAQINVVLKSGTNNFHGGLYYFFRNRELDAKNYFDLPDCTPASVPGTCGPIPRYQRSQYGATLGGPIVKGRTFFYLAFEGLALRQASTRQSTVPSQKDLATAYATTPPFLQNAAGVATLELYPAANVGPHLATSRLYVAAPVITTASFLGSAKLDQAFGTRDFLSGHYAASNQSTYNPYDPLFAISNLPGYGTNIYYFGQNIGVNWVHALSSGSTNSLRFGFNRDHLAYSQQNQGINRSAQLGYPGPSDPTDMGYPYLQINGFDSLGEPDTAPEDSVINTIQVSDDYSWIPSFNGGRHHFKIGGEYRHVGNDGYFALYTRGQWIYLGAATGNPLADVLLGAPSALLYGQGSPATQITTSSWNFYGMDDIYLTPKFTLNLGLRYEYNSAIVEVNNQFSIPDLTSASALCSPKPNCQFLPVGKLDIPRSGYDVNGRDFGPRVGFAYRPFDKGQMVIRSAYGIFYDVNILAASEFLHSNPPYFGLGYYLNSGVNNIQNILTSPLNAIVANTLPRHYPDSYMQQWNLSVQYGITPELVLEAGYYGSGGTHLIGFRNLNQSVPGGALPYPQYALILSQDKDRSSNYNALQIRVEQRMSHGFSLLGAYTWSKSIDNGSEWIGSAVETQVPQNSYNLAGERGLSSFNTGQRCVVSFVAQLPFGEGRKWRNHPGVFNWFLGGWQVSSIIQAQSGQPFTVNRSGFQSQTSLNPGSDRPDQIADPFVPGPVMSNPNPACHLTISQGGLAADAVHTPASWFNACAFSNPNLLGEYRFGTAGRNSVNGPGLVQLDLSLMKIFQLTERQTLKAGAQIFNIFNHPNFDVPVRIFDSDNFGALDSANAYGNRPPRQIQIFLQYAF